MGPIFAGRRGGLQEAEHVPAPPHPWLVPRDPVETVGLLRPGKDQCDEAASPQPHHLLKCEWF